MIPLRCKQPLLGRPACLHTSLSWRGATFTHHFFMIWVNSEYRGTGETHLCNAGNRKCVHAGWGVGVGCPLWNKELINKSFGIWGKKMCRG